MPRRTIHPNEPQASPQFDGLVRELVEELSHPKELGQPLILERPLEYAPGLQVHVVWDKFAEWSDEDRTNAILDAYTRVEGAAARDQIVLASGLTVPEAGDLGLLPVRLAWHPRLVTGETAELLAGALRQEGASWLRPRLAPELRFSTDIDADAAIERLTKKLPSEFRFVVVHDASPGQ